ncbi:acylphosphatase-1-like isoform X1 [Anabrus simplex]|uniref:acylphosphatase-1-like isoform X1 n=2 Tax=Anabrus simplex TaxID=316456 RepID=UPI0034DDC953
MPDGKFIVFVLLLGLHTAHQEEDFCTDQDFCNMSSNKKLVKLDFEVFGIVQGVFFRKNTVMQGKKLGLRGWCMNTSRGTVTGQLEGEPSKVDEMKYWLSNIGSKNSRIDKAEFRNEKEISAYSFTDFTVRH